MTRLLVIIVIQVFISACSNTSLPVSNGPFENTVPSRNMRILHQVEGNLIVPKPVPTQKQLGVYVDKSTPWGQVADAIRASVTGGEVNASFYVTDSSGAEHTIRFPLDTRLTTAIYAERGAEWIPDENVIIVSGNELGTLEIMHLNSVITKEEAVRVLKTALTARGQVYFPIGEAPSMDHFPAIVDPSPNVPVQDILYVFSYIQAAGFTDARVNLRGGR